MKPLVLAMLMAASGAAWADTIHLKSGGSLEGVILKRNQDGVVIHLKYATVTVGSFDIDSIEETAAPVAAGSRIVGWERSFQALVARPWGPELQMLPSRLITGGDYKNVPYVLHASDAYQIAIYGDPDKPAAIEIGVSGARGKLESARRECVDLLASLLTKSDDAAALRGTPMPQGRKESDGLVFETSEEPDSRGHETWWVSVTNPTALDAARVSDKELANLISMDVPVPPANPTLVQPSTGKGEKQEVITPFGTEPYNPKHRRKTYGGGGHWSGHVRWNHGHVTSAMPK